MSSTKRAPGRPRKFEREDVLVRISAAFAERGFAGSTLDDLTRHAGVQRPSLFSTFGNKKDMYIESYRLAEAKVGRIFWECLSREGVVDAVVSLFEAAAELYSPRNGAANGCFAIGTAMSELPTDHDIRELFKGSLRRGDEAFRSRFERAKEEGELVESAQPKGMALVISALLHELAIRSRMGASRSELALVIEQAKLYVEVHLR